MDGRAGGREGGNPFGAGLKLRDGHDTPFVSAPPKNFYPSLSPVEPHTRHPMDPPSRSIVPHELSVSKET